MKVTIGQIAQLKFGVHTQFSEEGRIPYLQVRHFDDEGNQSFAIDNFVPEDEATTNNLLREGDILLVSKGYRYFAWQYDSAIGPAIASSTFFVIKPDQTKVDAEYLTSILNLPSTQTQLLALGAGSSILSIRKSELQDFTIPLPPLETQRKVANLKKLHQRDMALSRAIIANKQKYYQEIIKSLVYS